MNATSFNVARVSPNSVEVTWTLHEILEVTSYIIYYSQQGEATDIEQTVRVPGLTNSVKIENLNRGKTYQFQMVAIAETPSYWIVGEMSKCINVSIPGQYICLNVALSLSTV